MATDSRTVPRTGTDAARRLRNWRIALASVFFLNGIAVATWVTRTPAIRDALSASTAEMGLVLVGTSIGSFVGISIAGVVVERRGARFVVLVGIGAVAIGLGVVALGAAIAQPVVVSGGLALLGYGFGSSEIGTNVSGVELERAMARSVIPGLHGLYSVGTVIGALLGLVANHLDLPVVLHLAVAAVVIAAVTALIGRHLPAPAAATAPSTETSAQNDDPAPDTSPEDSRRLAWVDRRLVALGFIILGMALAEGSATDWLPLIVVDGYGSTAAVGSVVYAFFGAAMAVGRLNGGRAIDRFGRTAVMRVSALIGAVGIATVVVAPTLWVGAIGVLLWGIGASLGFPVALSAAGDHPRYAARRASAVATAGYAAFLIGPPILGFLGQHVGLREAMLVVMVVVAATALFAGAVRGRPAPAAPAVPNGPA